MKKQKMLLIAGQAIAMFCLALPIGAQELCSKVKADHVASTPSPTADSITFTGEEGFFEKFDASERVSDGQEALSAAGIASLRMQFGWTQSGRCTGSVIADRWVLTAAHCLFTVSESKVATEVIVYHDSLKTWKGSKVSGTAYCHNDYGFRSGGYLNDIALIKLDAPLNNSPKMKLVGSNDSPMRNRPANTQFEAYGFGQLSLDKPSDLLMIGSLRTRESNQACVTRQDAKTKVFCSNSKGTSNAPSSLCPGDSGGAAVTGNGAARRQVGINSYVFNTEGQSPICGRDGNTAGFTEVHTYLGWIKAVTGIGDL